jgi:signal transduction histidine kinase
MSASGGDSLAGALSRSTEIAAQTLNVERVGIWLFVDDRRAIRCFDLFERSKDAHSEGALLRGVDIPTYFAALGERRYIAADDARTHPLTRELRRHYLEPLGIASMLDVPIYEGGEVRGVVCHEHVGVPRKWSVEDQDFAATVADSIALLMEEAARSDAERRTFLLQEQAIEKERLQAFSQLATGAIHDMRNLVSVVRWAARSIVEDRQATEVIGSHAERVLAATEAIIGIIRDLESLEHDRERLPCVVDLVAEAKRCLPLLRAAVGETCHVELTNMEPTGLVLVDPSQLERVLFNLVLNARDAMPDGGPISIEIAETTVVGEDLEPGIYVVLAIRDTGSGMAPETLKRIFEPYFTTRHPGTGRGIGLTLVSAVVERYGGFVHVESELGDGSTFRVYLPRVAAVAKL